MKRVLAWFLLLLLAGFSGSAASCEEAWQLCRLEESESSPALDYWLLAPEDAVPGLPLIVYLHGSGEKGSRALKGGLPLMLSNGSVRLPEAIVLVPQLPADVAYWDRMNDALIRIVDEVLASFSADPSRTALAGVSLGGIGVWDLAARFPGRFARILSLCGRVNRGISPDAFLGCEVRVYTAREDPKVPPASVIAFTKKLVNAGVDAVHTELNTTHARIPLSVFRNEELIRWLWFESD